LPIDATFPLFISAELPAGLTGLIIAGIFAAAMGTLSGTINSIATLLSVDFYAKIKRNPTEQQTKRFAEWMTGRRRPGRHQPWRCSCRASTSIRCWT
jgi:Na+/proline symporter